MDGPLSVSLPAKDSLVLNPTRNKKTSFTHVTFFSNSFKIFILTISACTILRALIGQEPLVRNKRGREKSRTQSPQAPRSVVCRRPVKNPVGLWVRVREESCQEFLSKLSLSFGLKLSCAFGYSHRLSCALVVKIESRGHTE